VVSGHGDTFVDQPACGMTSIQKTRYRFAASNAAASRCLQNSVVGKQFGELTYPMLITEEVVTSEEIANVLIRMSPSIPSWHELLSK
jgi:hypothetical protein